MKTKIIAMLAAFIAVPLLQSCTTVFDPTPAVTTQATTTTTTASDPYTGTATHKKTTTTTQY